MEEVWKDIKGYEGYYQISNTGRVKSLKRIILKSDGRRQFVIEKILKPWGNKDRYSQVSLKINKKRFCPLIHRLVAEAFIPNPDNKKEVNHKHGIKKDNRVSQLEWNTPSENQKHAFKKGLQINATGFDNPRSKTILVIKNGYRQIFGSMGEAARVLNIKKTGISNCIKGNKKTHGGYKFSLACKQN